MRITLHTFGSKNGKVDFNVEETDVKKRRYHFGIDLDNVDDTGKSFRQRYDTALKVDKLNSRMPHSAMQLTSNEVYAYCPDCIVKIKKALSL